MEYAAHQISRFPTYLDYLAHVRRSSATPNGVIGANIMWRQMPGAMQRMRTVREWASLDDAAIWKEALPGLNRYVMTYREDVLGQAISWAKALQTQQWTHADKSNGRVPKYDFALIDALYWDILAHNMAWKSWFAQHGIHPLRVKYEDVVADPVGEVTRVLTFLGLELPAGVIPQGSFRRQRDRTNDDWRRRCEEDFAARHIQVQTYQPA